MDSEDYINSGLRIDGRRATELRQIRIKLGVFGQADGSAYIEQGNTKVLAAVYGPRQPRGKVSTVNTKTSKEIINVQYSTAVFAFGASERKRKPRGDRKSQERALELRHVMEAIIIPDLVSRSQIDIFVEILQVDGSEFCVAVNAATLALIDAGIAIKDYAIGCSVTLTETTEEEPGNQGMGLLDANYVEECSKGATLSLVVLPGLINENTTSNPIIIEQASGQRLHITRLEPMKMRAVKGCRDIKNILDAAVRNHLVNFSVRSDVD